jgi:phosphatidylglycerophosphate synthase
LETLTLNQPATVNSNGGLAKRTFQPPAEELNIFQKISEATGNVVTPPNLVDGVAFAGAMYGIKNLDSWKGIIVTAASFLADMTDGPLARALKVDSPVGEAVDATGDKIKLAAALYQIWKLDLAPKPLLVAIAAQNGINAALTAGDRAINSQPVIHPSYFGKRAILLEQLGLGLHVIGSEVAKKHERRAAIIKKVGTLTSVTGLGLGAAATAGYAKNLFSSRKKA